MQTLDDLWYLAFGKISSLANKSRAKNQLAEEEYKKSIASKILSINENDLQEPPMSVVGPALEASKYYVEEETLREMFAKVIAASMDKSKSNSVHHSFVEIIKQLSPEDALNMTFFEARPAYPIVKFIKNLPNNAGYEVLKTNVFYGNMPIIITGDENATSITNLNRLGLVSISYEENLTTKTHYDIYSKSAYISNLQSDPMVNGTFDIIEGIVRITPLGNSFIKVCL
jgi:hypothetical protein